MERNKPLISAHTLDMISQYESDYAVLNKEYVNIWTHLANAAYDLYQGKGVIEP